MLVLMNQFYNIFHNNICIKRKYNFIIAHIHKILKYVGIYMKLTLKTHLNKILFQ